MNKKELILKFEELKKEHEVYMFEASETGNNELAAYHQGFEWGMELAKTMLERSVLK